MKRENTLGESIKNPRVDKFLSALEEISRAHGLSIFPMGNGFDFVVGIFNERDLEALRNAIDGTGIDRPP